MTITVVITKTKLAIAILAVALLVPATAMAVDSWSDTPDGTFYHDAVAWAKANGVTTGCNDGTGFCPDRTVTRGENVTFAHRYDTLVVQPALAKLAADVAANTAAANAAASTAAANAVTAATLSEYVYDSLIYLDAADLAAMDGTAKIPIGTTVTGNELWDFGAIDDNEDIRFGVQLPGRTPTGLTDGAVNFAPHASADDANAGCTGTTDAPTAPAGTVCIYTSAAFNVDGFFGLAALEPGFNDQMFIVNFSVDTAVQGADVLLYITWAYTAG